MAHIEREHRDTYTSHGQAQTLHTRQTSPLEEDPPSPADDWLLHSGNVHYVRNRSDFETYQRTIPGTASYVRNGAIRRPILGVGTVRIRVRRSAGVTGDEYLTLTDVHHVPTVPCNGVSLQRLEIAGVTNRVPFAGTFELYTVATSKAICCGSTSSGRSILCPAGSSPNLKVPDHFTLTADMNLDMSHSQRPKLSSFVEYPDHRTRSHYFPTHGEAAANVAVNGVKSDDQSGDDDWTAKEFWEAYRNQPERLKRKAEEKLAGRLEREAAARQRVEQAAAEKVIELEQRAQKAEQELQAARVAAQNHRALLQQPTSNDWLFHEGNVAFCRDRSMFETYKPISATAIAADGTRGLQILGIGSLTIYPRRQFGQPQAIRLSISGVLHIPSARCNGLGTPRFSRRGWTMKKKQGSNRVSIVESETNAALLCANSSSGRTRICMKDEGDGEDASEHVTCGAPISVWVDRAELTRLAPVWFCAE